MRKKQLSQSDWIYWFKIYQNHIFEWDDFFRLTDWKFPMTAKQRHQAKDRFRRKYQLYVKLGDNLFMSNKKKPTGRPQKQEWPTEEQRREKFEEGLKNLNEEELREIARRYYEITKDKKKGAAIEEFSQLSLSQLKIESLFCVSRQSISKYRRGYRPPKTRESKYNIFIKDINETFKDNWGNAGREVMSKLLLRKGISIPPRTVGNIMNRNSLFTNIRVAKRKSETRDMTSDFPDLVQHNFNPIRDNIIATDVKYIRCAEAHSMHYHIYFSAAISHKTKLIESWSLSKNNDIELVYKTLNNIEIRDGMIVHSDHGTPYISDVMVSLAKRKGYSISLKGTNDPLDNREIEYFFSILEVELLQKTDTSKMTFKEVHKLLTKWIYRYNNERIQKRTNWKAPIEVSAYKCVNS